MAATRHDLMRSGMQAQLAHMLGTDGRNGAATMVELMMVGMPAQAARLLGSDKPPPPGTPTYRSLVWVKRNWGQAMLLGVPP